jgi:hypothetical protein
MGCDTIMERCWWRRRRPGGAMQHDPAKLPPSEGRDGSDAQRLQILATEHWSLLATRSATWQEIFSRTGTFLTVLSATVVALSLVVQATGFGGGFRTFALVVLPIDFLLGLATFVRLIEADIEDAWLVIGMNRLRHAYLDIAPDLDRYFVTGRYDDERSLLQTYIFRGRVGVTHLLSGSPVIVGVIDSMIAGLLTALICQALGGVIALQVALGLVAALVSAVALGAVMRNKVRRVRAGYQPQFPRPAGPEDATPDRE